MKITPAPKGKTLLCLLGDPVAHSLSPTIHNTAFATLHLPYVYSTVSVKEEELPQIVAQLRQCKARGWNVTMPNKQAMVPLLDEISPIVRLTGSVNTVVQESGKLYGYQTDGIGLLRAVAECDSPISGATLVVLGAGGAASAIVAQAALEHAATIRVFARPGGRHTAQMKALAETLCRETDCTVTLENLEETETLREALSSAAILIQATSVGMAPAVEDSLIPDSSWLPKDLLVADIVYHPQKTRLLDQAEEAGCRICPGLRMLLYQGAEAFRLWTGQELPYQEVEAALQQALI